MANRCIIVGASHAASQLAPSLRHEGWSGEILVIGNEPHLPYHRPPLSKSYLVGGKWIDELLVRPELYYDKLDVHFLLGQVSSIDNEDQTVTLESGFVLHYDKLVICTGARVRRIECPGSELAGIHYLRTIADVQNIQKDLSHAKRIVVVGGGYIGLETASSLNKAGMDVTIVESASRVLNRVTAPELSSFYKRVHAEEGVGIITGTSITGFNGEKRVEEVVCEDGSILPADVVIVGIGVIPNIELAKKTGIKTKDGILIDKYGRTSDPNVFAAGDCALQFNAFYDREIRLESVPNANEQAKLVASSICGGTRQNNSLPWFWSVQYDLKLQIAGLSEGYDQVMIRGDYKSGRSFAAFYFKQGELLAADCVNRPQEFILAKKAISESLAVDPMKLADDSVPIKEMLECLV